MRWIVMAQSKVFMSINYALMVEVQKTAKGHRFKLQWDGRALSECQLGQFVEFFNEILEGIAANKYGTLRDLMEIKADLEGLWKA